MKRPSTTIASATGETLTDDQRFAVDVKRLTPGCDSRSTAILFARECWFPYGVLRCASAQGERPSGQTGLVSGEPWQPSGPAQMGRRERNATIRWQRPDV